MNIKLSKLESVRLRDVWRHEANDFSKWMADANNLQILGEIVDIDLEFVERESRVGKFSLDILAKDKISGDKIIIENQLGRTDHKHLGQLITYASGHDAAALIWVVGAVNSEHQKAIEWLNKNSSESIDFYLVKIELWCIGDSKPAPRFEVIESPSNSTEPTKRPVIRNKNIPRHYVPPFSTRDLGDPMNQNANFDPAYQYHWGSKKITGKRTQTTLDIREVKVKFLDFWTNFNEYLEECNRNFSIQSPRAQYYAITSPGFARSVIKLMVVPNKKDIRCRIRFRNEHRAFYDFLKQREDTVEKSLDGKVDWETHASSDSILMKLQVDDVFDASQQQKYFEWLADKATLFAKVFGEYYEKYQRAVEDGESTE